MLYDETLENKYLRHLEYIIRRHLNARLALDNDRMTNYVNDALRFFNEYATSNLMQFEINVYFVEEVWKDLRAKERNNAISFLMFITNKFFFTFYNEKELILKAFSDSLKIIYRDGIVGRDIVQSNKFKSPPNVEEVYRDNPWFLIISLFSLMEPIVDL